MDAGLIGMMLKGMGFDPNAVVQQATAIGAAFGAMQAQLNRMEANQIAIMGHMGLTVPDLPPEMILLIDAESRRHTQPPIRAVG